MTTPAPHTDQAEHPDQAAVCEVSCLHPQAVAQARARQPGPADIDAASALLKVIADPTRLKLLSALQGGELCVCDLAAVIGLSESAVSHQLRLMREQRVVTFRKQGRVAYYRLLDAHVAGLIGVALEHVRETEPSASR
ncbi:ArsR/SmtB family transcription factor [Deinococcus knuensis]|uniref:Transcriptional regulator n=1 Tax=Deinococcus knuensis TaxID=1837380 RepID=A0ABQ2SRK0_9DEIO|nr:metalloregulator ArsR/SmtB family transcription factor [Deinococcus knuensis]GGS35644.1 transcriptional regulator [Deinococcus knuensis]